MKVILSRIVTGLLIILLSFSSLSILKVNAQENSWTSLAPMQQPRRIKD